MGVIGGIVFAQVTGPMLEAPFPFPMLVNRPGTDGQVVRLMPAKSEPVEWRTIEWVLPDAYAALAIERYRVLQTDFVTATDDLGRWMEWVTVLDVQVIKVVKLAVAWPPANYAVHARWMLIRPG
jgi:hypothetical protein